MVHAQSLQLGRAPSILLHPKNCLLQFTFNLILECPTSVPALLALPGSSAPLMHMHVVERLDINACAL